jgi:hypothetical protein
MIQERIRYRPVGTLVLMPPCLLEFYYSRLDNGVVRACLKVFSRGLVI